MFYAYRANGKVRAMSSKAGKPRGSADIEILAPIPGNIAHDDFRFLQAIEATDEFGEKYWNITIDQAAKAAAQAAKQKQDDIVNSRKTKENAIKAKAEEVFPGLSAGQLVLKAEMWRHMSKDAAKFMGMALKTVEQVDAEDGTELFSPGSALDNPAKIKQYADRKLELYDAFLAAMALAEQINQDEEDAINNA